MNKTLIVLAVVALVVYYCYQKRETKKPALEEENWTEELTKDQINSEWNAFLKTSLNSNNLTELKTKLAGKTLAEILEERQSLVETLSKVEEQNEDWETEVDTLTRTKNSLEADLLAQSNSFQSRLREKDREIHRIKELSKESETQLKRLKADLVSEKNQHKGSITRISKLTEQITKLEKELKDLTDLKTTQGNIIKEQNKKIKELETPKNE